MLTCSSETPGPYTNDEERQSLRKRRHPVPFSLLLYELATPPLALAEVLITHAYICIYIYSCGGVLIHPASKTIHVPMSEFRVRFSIVTMVTVRNWLGTEMTPGLMVKR